MLTRYDLAKRWSVHINTIDKWRKLGLVPAPLVLGPNTIRWRESDIDLHDDWVQRRVDLKANGLDADQAAEPVYSLPMANDPHSLAREREAARHDTPPEDSESHMDGLRRRINELKAEARRLAAGLGKEIPAELLENS